MSAFTEYGWFFRGPVRRAAFGIFNTTYSLPSDGTVVKIKNSGHIRMIHSSVVLNEPFEVLAPMGDVKIISGRIPDSYMHHLHGSEYLRLLEVYSRF